VQLATMLHVQYESFWFGNASLYSTFYSKMYGINGVILQLIPGYVVW
jgi:hypothetical protein